MKKKLLSVLVAFAMVLTLLPVTAFAATSYIFAKDAEGIASQLNEATEDGKATGDNSTSTVTLNDDVALNVPFYIISDVTIDLNKHTLTMGAIITVYNDATVTIKNGEINNETCGAIQIGNIKGTTATDSGVLNLESVTVTSTASTAIIIRSDDGKSALTVENSTVKGKDFAIATNGSDAGATIVIENSTVESTAADACGIYLPAGSLTVSGEDTVIRGGAGIVVRGGTLNVEGGTIEATGSGNLEVGDAKTTVPAAGIAIDKNDAYNNGNVNVTISGGTISSDNGPAVSYTEEGSDEQTKETKVSGVSITGGKFVGGNEGSAIDEELLPANTVVGNGGYLTADTTVVGPAKLYDQLNDNGDGLYEENSYTVTAENGEDGKVIITIDATNVKLHHGQGGINAYWVGFSVKAPEGASSVTVKRTLPGEESATQLNVTIANVAGENFDQPGVALYLNAGNETLDGTEFEISWDDGSSITYVVKFADTLTTAEEVLPTVTTVITDGDTNEDNQSVDVALSTEPDSTVGYYYEVTVNADSLVKTKQNGTGAEAYYTGFAVAAPEGATQMKYAFNANGSLELSGTAIGLEKAVADSKDGIAFYVVVTADAEGALSLDAEWARVQWLDESGKVISTETYHITLGDVTLAVDGIEATMTSVGFKADAEAAKEGVEKDVNDLEPATPWTADDCGPNTMWGVFSAKVTGSKSVVVKASYNGTEFADTEIGLTDANKGGVIYFEFGRADQVNSQELKAGVYTFTVYAKEDSTLIELDSMELEVYETKYVIGDGCEVTNADELPDYVVENGDGYSVFYMENEESANPLTVAATEAGKTVKTTTATDGYTKTITYTAEEPPYIPPYVPPTTTEPEKPCDGGADCPSRAFTDLNVNAWYHEGVDYVLNNGLMEGMGGGIFAPNSEITRGQLVTILYRLEGEPAASRMQVFTDVPAGRYYTDAVAWAAANGIVDGMEDGTFLPGKAITRQDLATILYRYASYKGYDVTVGDLSVYPDAGSVSGYAKNAMAWAVGSGVVEGSDGKLLPKGSARRCEAATMLMRFCQKVVAK